MIRKVIYNGYFSQSVEQNELCLSGSVSNWTYIAKIDEIYCFTMANDPRNTVVPHTKSH